MSKTKYRFTYDEVRVIVLALVELKNQLIQEGRYTDVFVKRKTVHKSGRKMVHQI